MILIKDYEEKVSKAKSFRLLITSVIFVVIGIWAIKTPTPDSVIPIFRIRFVTFLIGMSCAVFFSFGIIAFMMQIFSYKLKFSRVIIGDSGLIYYSKEFIIGPIPWNDIVDMKINIIKNHRYLTILVHNPLSYINKQNSLEKRKDIELNFGLTGSPINIKTGFFETKIEKLKMKIETKLKENK
jgi:hypothetical protein